MNGHMTGSGAEESFNRSNTIFEKMEQRMSSEHRRILITDNRSQSACAAAAHLLSLGYCVVLNQLGGDAVAGTESVFLDLTDESALASWFEASDDAFYAVIHPAPPPIHAAIATATEDDWQQAFRDGALAALLVTKTAGRQIGRASCRGRV